MTNLNSSLTPRLGLNYTPMSFLIRLGRREIFVCRDFRRRCYSVHPVLECSTGIEPGYLEMLIMRRWLVILSKAR